MEYSERGEEWEEVCLNFCLQFEITNPFESPSKFYGEVLYAYHRNIL